MNLAQMKLADLESALAKMGLEHDQKNISAKINRGKFSATFLVQMLVAIGVEQLDLPSAGEEEG